MAKYCYFTCLFKKVSTEIEFVRSNIGYVEGEGVGTDLNFSTIKRQDQTILKLEYNYFQFYIFRECAKNILKVSVDAFLYLESAYKRSSPQFVNEMK